MRCPVRALVLLFLVVLLVASPALANIYDVGPGQALTSIGSVPWESLVAGDIVRIHWRSTPYKEKFVIGRQGSAVAPILIQGVPGPNGELPVIDGNGATTRLALDFASEGRGVIKIGSSSIPADTTPKYIVIEKLIVQGARSSYSFVDDGGATQSYSANASTIYVEKGENITIRDCELRDAGNGFFVASSDALASRDILVERSYIHDNGNVGSIFEHNLYVAGVGLTFQFNRLGPLAAGASGNNLKDRSAGLVVRYNWIEGGNRQLDLVDGEDSAIIRNDPRYRQTHVYGNILIEPDAAGNRQLVHYGGDSGTIASYRKGTLYFHNNTVISHRTDRTTIFRLSTNEERCDARNNVMWLEAANGTTLSLLDTDGVLDWSHNWTEAGWRISFGTFLGTVNDDGTTLTGAAPGFCDAGSEDYGVVSIAAVRNSGTALAPAIIPTHSPVLEYVKHVASQPRALDATLDIGAFEYAPVGEVAGLTIAPDRQTLSWLSVPRAREYEVIRDTVAALRSGAGFGTCVSSGSAIPSASDLVVPAVGAGFVYLVRGLDCAGAGGTWGPGRDGVVASPCP